MSFISKDECRLTQVRLFERLNRTRVSNLTLNFERRLPAVISVINADDGADTES
jgi:hypothetical protein